MSPKEYLQQYRVADRAINAKLDYIQRLRQMQIKVTQIMVPDKIQTAGGNRVADITARIIDLEREVDREIDQLQEIKGKVEAAIERVPDVRAREILRLRYINGKKWEEIAVELNYNYRWVTKLHGEALKKLALESPY